MSEFVPEGWGKAKIGDAVVSANGGVSVNSENRIKSHKEYGILKTSSVFDGFFDSLEHKTILQNEVIRASVKPIKNHIIFSRMNTPALVGQSGFVDKDYDDLFLPDRLWQIKVDDQFNPKWLSYTLRSKEVVKYITDAATGTSNTMKNIAKPNLMAIPMLYPPLPEQQKIAAILTSVDEVIEKTQAQINKLKDLKTGMMQELLTRGVGVDGKPHTEFKDSPVGRIPKAWDCCLLDKMARRGSGHTPDKQKSEYWNDGIKWVSLTDSSKLDNLYIHDTSKKISQLGIENSSATLHPKGTVVMARDAGIGKSAIMTSSMAVSQHFMAWVCSDELDNYFLYYLLQHWKSKFEAIAMGSTIKTIGLPYFKKLQIPVPQLIEQKLISSSLKSIDEKVFILKRKHLHLNNTRKALMQDLLTGKVRVKVDTE